MATDDKNKRRGVFIVVEGLDRSGKSTQVSALLERLEGLNIPARHIRFPDRTTPIGKTIDAYLRSESDVDDHAIHLLFSANRWELASTIEQTLNSGTTIISDRYAFSGIAYSASKTSLSLPFTWCKSPDIGLPSPDLTVFLDISPTQALQRSGYGRERYENEGHQKRVREVFLRIADDAKKDGGGLEWVTIDAARSVEDVREDIWREVEKALAVAPKKPIGRLWVSEVS